MTSTAEISEDVFPTIRLLSLVSKDDMYVGLCLDFSVFVQTPWWSSLAGPGISHPKAPI